MSAIVLPYKAHYLLYLRFPQLPVMSIRDFDEISVPSGLDYLALVKDDDPIACRDCRQSMCYRDGGLALRKLV